MTPDDLRAELAAIEHQRWDDWQRYLHDQGIMQPDGSILLPAHLVTHWERQIATPYAELSEREQAEDLKQVDRYWPLVAHRGPKP